MYKFFTIACLAAMLSSSCTAQSHQLDVGNQIPPFSLKDQDGNTFNMEDSVGNNLFVIFFYPKDESIICTKEACTFRDSMNLFKKYGVRVIGINQGSVESHKKFQKDDSLNFELLSDPDETVIKKFGVKGGLFTQRITYVVDETGEIVFKTESTTDGKKHVRETLAYIRQLKKHQKQQENR